jgi:hypothetical protein
MKRQPANGYRGFVTAIFVAAMGLLPLTASAAAGPNEKLQVLVNDTAAQFRLVYRQQPGERALRQEQLATAIAAWRAAPRSEANNERLATWLRAAILSSMPGSQEPLPAVPGFAAMVKAEPQPQVHVQRPQPTEAHESPLEPQVAEKKAPTEAVAKPDNDPFRDDSESDAQSK